MLIKLELECTPLELIGIGQVMEGHTPVVLDTPLARGEIPAAEAADIERTDHIEATIPVSEGGTKIEEPASPAADAFAEKVIPTPDGTVTITAEEQQPASPAADAFAEKTPPSVEQAVDAVVSVNGVDVAKGTNGQMIPWDARIHGKAKNKNADGSWRLLQGVDRDTFVPQVEGELVSALTAPKPAEGASVPSPEQPVTTQQSPAVVTPTAPDAAPTVPNPPAASTKPTTFPELLPLVTAAKAAGTLTDETIANACAKLGLATFGLIATRPDLIPQAAELLGV